MVWFLFFFFFFSLGTGIIYSISRIFRTLHAPTRNRSRSFTLLVTLLFPLLFFPPRLPLPLSPESPQWLLVSGYRTPVSRICWNSLTWLHSTYHGRARPSSLFVFFFLFFSFPSALLFVERVLTRDDRASGGNRAAGNTSVTLTRVRVK